MMITGRITFDGLDDGALIILIDGNKQPLGLGFDPCAMRMQVLSKRTQDRTVQVTRYNDATLTWTTLEGLKTIETLLGKLRVYQQAPLGSGLATVWL